MDKKTQCIIVEHILADLQKYQVNTMDGIGLLEGLKLSLFNDSIKKVK